MPLAGFKRTAVEAALGTGVSYATNYAMGRMFPMKSGVVTGGPAGAISYTRERHRVGRRKNRVRAKMRDILALADNHRSRWQLCSGNLNGPGRIPLSFGGYGATSGHHDVLPIHFMSLSQNYFTSPNSVSENKGTYPYGMFRVIRNWTNGKLSYRPMQPNTKDGVNQYDANCHWQTECGSSASFLDHSRKFHKWTSVKMNLYGAKAVPITYTISVVQCKKNYSPFQHTPTFAAGLPGDNIPEFSDFTRWIQDVSRTLIGNPINTSGTNKHYLNNVRVIKQKRITINPLSYTNAAAEASAPVKAGNVRQFSLFLNHNRWRNYSWTDTDATVDQDRNWADLGWDVKISDYPVTDVTWNQRVYLFVTCTVGGTADLVQNDTTNNYIEPLTDMPVDFGSYDIIVRSSFE